MGLELEVDGIKVKLEIRGYLSTDRSNWYSEWCKIDYSFSFKDSLNFHKENYESLLSCEIDYLVEQLANLLDNKITETVEISFLEHDLEFVLSPSFDVRTNPNVIYVEPGFEISDITLEWRIYFNDQWATANYLTITLDRNEINSLLEYLKSEQNQ